MIPYAALADATLAQGAMPAVVPQLKSITLGGAVAGVGIEASSFRHGLVHDTVTALDVLTADGRIVHCTPDNEHRDLFFGFPNSYGTLGYALAVTARARPGEALRAPRARPPFRSRRLLRRDRPPLRRRPPRFPGRHGVRARRDVPDARPLRGRRAVDERLHVRAHLLPVDPRARQRLPRRRATTCGAGTPTGSGARRTSTRSIRWCAGCSAASGSIRSPTRRSCAGTAAGASPARSTASRGRHAEAVIQDVDIPLDRAAEFLAFLHREIGILPVWLCPIRPPDPARRFPLYPLRPEHDLRQFRVLGRRARATRRGPRASSIAGSSARSRSSPASSRSIRTRSTPRTNSGRSTTAARIGR